MSSVNYFSVKFPCFMDENVKVGVGFITNYVMKKIKLAFANYPQRGGKKMYRETEREKTYI